MAAHSYKHSRMRTGKRRSHHALQAPGFTVCPRCTQPTIPHRVCGNCGFYKGERVVDLRKA